MQRNSSRLMLVVAAAFLASSSAPLFAAGTGLGFWDAITGMTEVPSPNLKLGQLAIHPYFRLTESYDSNIFLQPRSKVAGQNAANNTAGPVVGSWITDTSLGTTLELPLSEINRLSGGYDFMWRAYSKDPSINNTVNQAANAAFDHKGGSLVANLHDNYINTTDPATSELTARSKRYSNAVGGKLEYGPEGGDLFAGVDAEHTVNKYIADNPALRAALNRYEELFGGRAGYKLQPKTNLFLAYHRDIIHYAVAAGQSKDSKSHLVDVGIDGEIAPKVTGGIKTGFSYRKYDTASASGNTVARHWTVSADLRYKPIERTAVSLNLSRSLQEATFGTNQYFLSNRASLAVSHKLPGKVSIGANAGFEVDKYPENVAVGGSSEQRRDDLYTLGASLDYHIQPWLSTGVSHVYKQRNSIFTEQFNYVDNITALKLSLQF